MMIWAGLSRQPVYRMTGVFAVFFLSLFLLVFRTFLVFFFILFSAFYFLLLLFRWSLLYSVSFFFVICFFSLSVSFLFFYFCCFFCSFVSFSSFFFIISSFQEIQQDKNYKLIWDHLNQIASGERGYVTLRTEIQNSNPPVIPYLGRKKEKKEWKKKFEEKRK